MNDKTPPAPQPQQPEQEQQYFMVPAVALGAVVEILQELPYKQVQHLIPVLTNCQMVSGKPKEEKK